jgi:hypothetical protein
MNDLKEFLEYDIFADLEPDHDGKELHIFKKDRDKKQYKLDDVMRKVEEMLKKD